MSFQLQIQHEKSIEDLNGGMYANRVLPACQYSAGILNSALRLPSNRSDHSVILRRQTKSLRSIVTDFNFVAVKLPLNLPKIALFLILSLPRKPVRKSPLLSKSLLKLTEPFWISHVCCIFFLASDINFRKFLAE